VLQPERAQDLVDHRGVGNLGLVLGLGTRHGVGGRLLAGEHRAPIRVRLLPCAALDLPFAFQLHAELGEERDGGIQVVGDDGDVVHSLNGHVGR
jgi:hypothetical protein